MKTTAYDILELSPDASQEDIEAAYREQVQAVDPTVLRGQATSDTAFRYKLLREAYALISDPHRRMAYDLALRYPPSPTAAVGAQAQTEPVPRVWCSPGVAVLMIAALFLASALWGKHAWDAREAKRAEERAVAERMEQDRLARIERARQEAARAEERRLSAQFLANERQTRVEMEQARYEGQWIHESLWRAEQAAAEHERRAAYEQERQARYDQYREQVLAQQRRYLEQRDAERRLRNFEPGAWVAVLPPPRRLSANTR